jgi:hypothetical protein
MRLRMPGSCRNLLRGARRARSGYDENFCGGKTIKKIDRIFEFFAHKTDVLIPPPASAEELKQCQKNLIERGFPLIPQRYFAFLKGKCNGFSYTIEFYGTKPINYSGRFVEDIVTANEESNRSMKYRLLIGQGWSCYYFFNTKNKLYETRSRVCGDLWDEYKTFLEMFD